jgi:hypothetical protein
MKLAIAGLLLAISAGSAIAQTTGPGTSTAPDSAATGTSPEPRPPLLRNGRELRAMSLRQLQVVRLLPNPADQIRQNG